MTTLARQIAAAIVSTALVAAAPLVCLCAPSAASARETKGVHDCCGAAAGVSVVDDGCCGGPAVGMPDSIPPVGSPTTTAGPVVAVFAPATAPARLAILPRASRPPSPPTVLRI